MPSRGDNIIGTPHKPEMTYCARSLVSIGGFLHLMILHSLGLICKFTSIVVEKLGMALEIWLSLSSASHSSWSIRWMLLVGKAFRVLCLSAGQSNSGAILAACTGI